MKSLTLFRQPVFLTILSGIFLVLSFSGSVQGWIAWGALIPLFAAFERFRSRLHAWTGGLVCGFFFYAGSLVWLNHVVFIGWVFVVALESFFMGLFVWLAFEIYRKTPSFFWRLVGTAWAWMTMEWLRSEIPVLGFGWNLLAYSQAEHLPMAQWASLGGAYALGFLMVIGNGLFFDCIQWGGLVQKKLSGVKTLSLRALSRLLAVKCFGLFLFFGILLGFGVFCLSWEIPVERQIRISVLQGNIPQSVKWEPMEKDKILDIYLRLLKLAVPFQPDLVIWPEASFPGYFNLDPDAEKVREEISVAGVSNLIGAPHYESMDTIYNSAYAVNAEGLMTERYDKQRLVPFGEYVPFKPLLGFLEPVAYAMGVSDFTAGWIPTVFSLDHDSRAYSVLICFEDIFPSLARTFVQKGARFLVVMTNDAWFGKSQAPYQHLAASIFRAIENGVPVIRSANTGVSAFLGADGTIKGRVQNKAGQDTFVAGYETELVPLDKRTTLYQQGGYLFAPALMLLGSLVFLTASMKRLLKKR